MEEYEAEIIKYIERNYDITRIIVEEVPQGRIVKENGKETIIYWDFENNRIITK